VCRSRIVLLLLARRRSVTGIDWRRRRCITLLIVAGVIRCWWVWLRRIWCWRIGIPLRWWIVSHVDEARSKRISSTTCWYGRTFSQNENDKPNNVLSRHQKEDVI
jgi:hypothetical protein